MYGYYYGFDPLYLYLVLPAILLSLIASMRVKTTFSKYSGIPAAFNGADAARKVLESNGVTGVRIERVSGNLTDHFDPKTNVIRLSDSVYGSYSISAVGVAAHEAGHAVQHAVGYTPIKIRSAIFPVSSLGSRLSLPLLLIGLLFNFTFLMNLGVIFFGAALIFQLVTLPVEFNASARALGAIKVGGLLDEKQISGAKKVLTAAAMTYITSFLVSLTQFLRLLALTNRRR
ncbi:MAG: zinc metallopeptidase [Acutalibacteraceae bacterium]|nr:zinc metallopeptidase [Acutalibacteraceae bacterium]